MKTRQNIYERLATAPLFAWVRSRWFLRWHLAHLIWVMSAIPLLGFAGWKAIFDGDAAWTIFIFGWVAAGIWLRVDSFLEAQTDEVRADLDAEIEAQDSSTEANVRVSQPEGETK